jgi:predicted ArsR family transcriptional regulator
MNQYKKITQKDVEDRIIDMDFVIGAWGYPIAAQNIASLLETSLYQVRNHLANLKREGLVQVKTITERDEWELNAIKGWILTENGREKFKIRISEKEEEYEEGLREAFAS